MISEVKTYEPFLDDRGSLLPLHMADLPFEVKRTFYITNVPKYTFRGGHAHHKTEQVLICLTGSVVVTLHDGWVQTGENYLLEANQSIYIPNLVWDKQFTLDDNTNLAVLCSTEFDPDDYIPTIEELTNIVTK